MCLRLENGDVLEPEDGDVSELWEEKLGVENMLRAFQLIWEVSGCSTFQIGQMLALKGLPDVKATQRHRPGYTTSERITRIKFQG